MDKFYKDFNYKPNTSFEDGIVDFFNWYEDYK